MLTVLRLHTIIVPRDALLNAGRAFWMNFCSLETDSLLLSAVVLGVNCSLRGVTLSPCELPFYLLSSLFLSCFNHYFDFAVPCKSHLMGRFTGYPLLLNDVTLWFMYCLCTVMSDDTVRDLLWKPDTIESNVVWRWWMVWCRCIPAKKGLGYGLVSCMPVWWNWYPS